ncbi:MAG: hydantoinase/oxoprolinase family protein [Gemmatimonadaceae bacterium]|nr:hydantoinase/oxoprolinase family protein [Gemmatimonadaceae bacterium]
MTLAIGIDVGGTFTDLAAIADDGTVQTAKVPTTPGNQADGVVAALAALGASSSTVVRLAHGTTVVTNLLLERSGARVLVLATEGATDLLRLRRQERASLYDLSRDHPEPLVDAGDVLAVPERQSAGIVVRELTAADAGAVATVVADRLDAGAGEIVAISLLESHESPAHERRLREAIAAEWQRRGRTDSRPPIVCAHEVLPEIREYERTATTVAEAYARPRVAAYLASLAERVTAAGYPAPMVVTSSGGMLPAHDAAHRASSLALSGPAGGVVGAAAICRALRVPLALTVDIGGTSADAGVIRDYEPLIEAGGDVAGVPLALPRVLVETVSAGGGSVGWVDASGALRVGPRSAGAVPGPACFGRGGTEPTVTDAQLVLGRVSATPMSGGVSLDVDAARDAVGRLATTLGASVDAVAMAMITTADAAMARALRRVSVERGIDPRHAVLLAFGGGGPLHACGLAERLGMRDVIVPPHAGVLSALGLALAPERRDGLASLLRDAASLSAAELTSALEAASAATAADATLARQWWCRARYRGQGHALEVPAHRGDDGSTIASRFHAQHQAQYGFALDAAVETVGIRCTATGVGRQVVLAAPRARAAEDTAADETADAVTPVAGPATRVLSDATLFIADGWHATPLSIGGWRMERR